MNEINNCSTLSTKNKTSFRAIVTIIISAIFLIIITSSTSCSSSYLTYENYMKIHDGMTYSEVVEVLDGHQGTASTSSGFGGYTISYYIWSNSSETRCISVGFLNGKVVAKSQVGLT